MNLAQQVGKIRAPMAPVREVGIQAVGRYRTWPQTVSPEKQIGYEAFVFFGARPMVRDVCGDDLLQPCRLGLAASRVNLMRRKQRKVCRSVARFQTCKGWLAGWLWLATELGEWVC